MRRLTFIMATVLTLSGLTACTTVQSTRLPMSSMNHCAAPEGVSVKYGTLTIALGERPSLGYGIEIIGQQEDDGAYDFIYRETRPQPDRMYGQVITQPCVQVVLPSDWKRVKVTAQQSGQTTVLTPADDLSLVAEKRAGH